MLAHNEELSDIRIGCCSRTFLLSFLHNLQHVSEISLYISHIHNNINRSTHLGDEPGILVESFSEQWQIKMPGVGKQDDRFIGKPFCGKRHDIYSCDLLPWIRNSDAYNKANLDSGLR